MRNRKKVLLVALVLILLLIVPGLYLRVCWRKYYIGMGLEDAQKALRRNHPVHQTDIAFSTFPLMGQEAETNAFYIIEVSEEGLILYFNYHKRLIRKSYIIKWL